MPFFMVDDQLHAHRKVDALLDLGPAGLEALGLWTLAGSYSQAQLSDGVLTMTALSRRVGSPARARKLAKMLVDVELWEEGPGTGTVRFHDWRQFHKPGDAVKNERERRAELKRAEVVEAVKARDGDRCRYCGKRVNWRDRKGALGGTYDHVDPGLVAGVENIVVACRSCNATKARRTPEQAGMTLLPPPTPEGAPEAASVADSPPESGRKSGRAARSDLAEMTSPRGGAGTRAGDGLGSGGGHGSAHGSPSSPEPPSQTEPRGRAGPPPPGAVRPPEAMPCDVGSPWANHHGPAPNVDEPQCPIHDLDLPCRKCAADHLAAEAEQPPRGTP